MTLNSAIESELPFLRSEAEARMVDTCRITRAGTGTGDWNDETGQYDAAPATVTVYEGPCRLPRRDNLAGSTSQAGDTTWQIGEYPLALPIEHTGFVGTVKVGHTVTFLTAADPELVGNEYGITEVADQSQAIERRFRMKRITGLA